MNFDLRINEKVAFGARQEIPTGFCPPAQQRGCAASGTTLGKGRERGTSPEGVVSWGIGYVCTIETMGNRREGMCRNPFGRDILGVDNLTVPRGQCLCRLLKTEVQLIIVEPRDVGFDSLPRQYFGQMGIMSLEQRSVGRIVQHHDNGLLLHPHAAFQTLKQVAGEVQRIP